MFLLNASLFILIGLQLPVIVDGLEATRRGGRGYTALVFATVIGVRFVWVFTMPYLIRVLDRRPEQRERRVGRVRAVVSAWSGMRGAVSLAAALALPLQTDAGVPLEGRDLILFITFALILVTVVGQGLTLPGLIRRLGVARTAPRRSPRSCGRGWRLAGGAGAVDELAVEDWTRDETVERARGCTSSASGASRCAPERSTTTTGSRTARSPSSA